MIIRVLTFLIVIVMLCGCKSDSVEDAFYSKHEGNEILHIHRDHGGAVVFYQAPFDNGTGIGAAIIEGDDNSGWEYLTSSAIYMAGFMFNIDRVNFIEDRDVRLFYGVLDDPSAERIIFENKHGKQQEAQIIDTNWKRIWFAFVAVPDELKFQILDKERNILYKVPAASG